MEVAFKKLTNDAIVPTRGSKYAAGYDLYASECYCLWSGDCVKISTGIAMSIPNGYFGAIYARSGLATKEGLRPANAVGVVDCDFTGEIIVPLFNDSSERRVVEKGERIAQIVFQPYLDVELFEVDELDKTERGNGGFGSTGK